MKKQPALNPYDQRPLPLPVPNQNSQIEAVDPVVNGTKAQSNDGGYIWIV